jgi:hypothetical protein
MTKTPGFDHRISIKLSHDRHGRKLAHRWSMAAMRWFRISLADAELWLAMDAADLAGGKG